MTTIVLDILVSNSFGLKLIKYYSTRYYSRMIILCHFNELVNLDEKAIKGFKGLAPTYEYLCAVAGYAEVLCLQPVLLQLFGNKVPLGYLHFLLLRVPGHLYQLQAVSQCRWDCLCCIDSAYEQDCG